MIKRTYGAHPLMIVNLVKPFLFVLILPVIKGLLQYLITGRVTGLLSFEITAAVIVLFLAVLRLRAFRVSIDGEKMIIEKGLFFKTVAVIRRERLSCVSGSQNLFDLLFSSVTYKVNTEAGAAGKTDFFFKLRKKDAKEMSGFLYGEEKREEVRFNALKSAVFAAATSSAVTGLIVGVPIINNLGRILGVALSGALFDEINNASSRFDAYFPPIVNVITVTLIAGYLFSFAISFVKMLGFRLRIGADESEVEYGLISRNRTVFKKSAVNDVCIEATPLMRLFGMFSMRAAVGGYGDKRGEKAIIVPAARHGQIKNLFREYFPFLYPDVKPVRPQKTKRNLMRFLFSARLAAAADIAATVILSLLFPAVMRFLIFSGAAVMAGVVYYGNLCFRSYKLGRLCISDKIFASGFKGFTVRELYCEKHRVGEIIITETPADRRYGTCKAEIAVCSESADKIKVRNISRRKTLAQIEKAFGISV